jgi:hypothetical protein
MEQIMTGHESQPVNASQNQTYLLCKTVIIY